MNDGADGFAVGDKVKRAGVPSAVVWVVTEAEGRNGEAHIQAPTGVRGTIVRKARFLWERVTDA